MARTPSGPALIQALASVVLGGALSVAADIGGASEQPAVAPVALVALAVLLAGLVVRRAEVVWLAVVGVGLAGVIASMQEAAPVFAAGLYVMAELAFASIERRAPAHTEAGTRNPRAPFVAAVAAASVALGAVLWTLGRGQREPTNASALLAAAGVVGIAAIVVVMVRGTESRPNP